MYVEDIGLARKNKPTNVKPRLCNFKIKHFYNIFITFLKGEQWDKNEARMDVPSLPSFANMVSCALR